MIESNEYQKVIKQAYNLLSSPTGPAEHCAGGSLSMSLYSYGQRKDT